MPVAKSGPFIWKRRVLESPPAHRYGSVVLESREKRVYGLVGVIRVCKVSNRHAIGNNLMHNLEVSQGRVDPPILHETRVCPALKSKHEHARQMSGHDLGRAAMMHGG